MAAKCDLPVIDATEVARTIEEIQQIIQVYNEAVQIFNSVAEITGVDALAPALNDPAMRNPLPFAAADAPGWIGGYNDAASIPFGNVFIGQNTVGGDPSAYQDGSFVGGELYKGIQSISGMQAVAAGHAFSIEQRIAALADLATALTVIGTVQESAALHARLGAEANFAHSQQIQGTQLMAAAQLNMHALTLNQRQFQFLDESNGIATMCGALSTTASSVSIPECSQ
jgi:hypothetical protein